MERSTMVVVGVDGSPGSGAALAHALDEAARRRCWLRVVTAYEPVLYPQLPEREVEGEVVRRAREFVNGVLRTRPGAGVPPVSIVAVPGPAGEALVDESRGAALLVIGHRGRSAPASAVLGSVGLHCLLHATSAVTVVPARQDGAAWSGNALLAGAALP